MFKNVRPVSALISATLLAGLGLVALPAKAADANNKFASRGVGSANCETFTAAVKDPAQGLPYVSWLIGYASATNKLTPQTFDIIPTEDGLDFVRSVNVVCIANRTINLATAAGMTVDAMRPLRQSAETPYVILTYQGKSMRIRQGAVQLLAAGLAAKQLYRGDTSGQPNPDLYKAIKTLQENEKIAVTGLPDIDTFIRAIIKR